jgi:hypothetical protein
MRRSGFIHVLVLAVLATFITAWPSYAHSLLVTTADGTNSILRYNGMTGAFIDAFVPSGSGGLSFACAMTIGPSGDLFVASLHSNEVLRYNGSTGAFVGAFVSAGSGGLAVPCGVAFGPDGNLYVSSIAANEILKYDGTTGAFIDVFVPAGTGGLYAPGHMYFRPDGNLYVGGGPDGNGSIYRFNSISGAYVDTLVSGRPKPIQDMVFGSDGNIYGSIFHLPYDGVEKYDGTTGAFLGMFIPHGSGGLDGPAGMVLGSDGILYVGSQRNGMVLRYSITTGAFIDVFVAAGSGGLDPGSTNGIIFGPDQVPTYNICPLYDQTKSVKSGATVPIKLQLCDSLGRNLSASTIVVKATSLVQISTNAPGPVEDSGNANPDSNFRYDATLGGTGGYIFNLKTTGLASGTYKLNFTAGGDPLNYSVAFQVK